MKEYVINKWVTSTGVPVPEQGESKRCEGGVGSRVQLIPANVTETL